METVFSKIIRGELPADVVYQDDEMLAFRDIHPVAPVHILIIPKKEIVSLASTAPTDAALLGKMLLVARALAESEGIAETGYRIVTNSGPDSGREVEHLHFHLIGGKGLGSKICQ
jgi:histidine triad (HIT) family protein